MIQRNQLSQFVHVNVISWCMGYGDTQKHVRASTRQQLYVC